MTRFPGRTLGFAVFGAIATALALQPYRMVRFTGASMEPTFKNGEIAIAIAHPSEFKVGDVVVIDTDSGPIVKRVIKVPGDRILEAKMPLAGWQQFCLPRTGKPRATLSTRWAAVPAGFIYVLGDNLIASEDSRAFGSIPISRIRAKLLNPRSHPLPDYAWLPALPSAS